MRSHETSRILSISNHEAVSVSCELLLQSVGYSVVSMSSHGALQAEIPRDIEIAIIGQTVDDRSASRIVTRLRADRGNIRILRLTEQYSPSGCGFDRECSVELGPEVFLSRVAELAETGKTVAAAERL